MRTNVVRDIVFMTESPLEKSKELALSLMIISQGISFFICTPWIIIPYCPFLKDFLSKNFFYVINILLGSSELLKVIYMCKILYSIFPSKS